MIKSLKDGQLSMDRRMTTVTDKVQNQMDAMNLTLGNLQNILLHTLGVSAQELASPTNCLQSGMSQTEKLHIGTQPVLQGGLGKL